VLVRIRSFRLIPLALLLALASLVVAPAVAGAQDSSQTVRFTAYAAEDSFRFVDADENNRLSVGDYFVLREKLYASLADLRADRNVQATDRVKCVADRVRGSGQNAQAHWNCRAVFTANDGSTLVAVASFWDGDTRFTGSVISGTGQGQGATGKIVIEIFRNYSVYRFVLVLRN
jgi:hypothetical protein